MELDFSKLNNLALMDFTELPPEKQPSKTPLELELEEVQGRLERLIEASKRGTETADSLQRIERAIQAHKQRATELKGMIEKAQGGESLTA